MDELSINQQVFIKRSDGRVHLARIIKLEGGSNNVVTVEWDEGSTVRGKELPIEVIVELNPQIFDRQSPQILPQPNTNNINNSSLPLPPKRSQSTSNSPAVVQPIAPRASPEPLKLRLIAGANNKKAIGSAVPRQRETAQIEISPSCNDAVFQEIDRLRVNREKRRTQQATTRAELKMLKNAYPDNLNWEIARMIRLQRLQMEFKPLDGSGQPRKEHQIMVCVRKRPLNRQELTARELDVISVPSRDLLIVHEPRKQVDLTKFLENHNFRFDYTFNDQCSNATVYEYTAKPLVEHIFNGGMATCFAYGQTGSGKTHTMGGQFMGKVQSSYDGIYAMAASDVFAYLPNYVRLALKVTCTFFEIYGTRVYDLLMPGKPELRVMEDGRQQVQVVGLTEKSVNCTEDVLKLIDLGNSVRTSGQTSANSKSSRSHAVFQIVLRSGSSERLHGKFSLIDLAGNERGADNCSSDRQTRLEGSEINKSLLALKECIRALSRQSSHLPFRGSKLTQVLRDSFIGGKKVKTCMIAMISPGLRSCEHTLNTLRYADRVKELTARMPPKRIPTPELQLDSSPKPDIEPQVDRATKLTRSPSASSSRRDASNSYCTAWNAQSASRELQDNNLEYYNAMTDSFLDVQRTLLDSFSGSSGLAPCSPSTNPSTSNELTPSCSNALSFETKPENSDDKAEYFAKFHKYRT